MEEDKFIEISLNQFNKLQKAIYNSMELLGDINITGYTRNSLRKDTQKKIVDVYDTLFALNKYMERIRGKNE